MSRRRFIYDPELQDLVEVGEDFVNHAGPSRKSDAEVYGGLQATDGTPIDSRTKHRRYMKERDLSLTSDWTETWAKAAEKRAEVFTTGGDHKQRREQVERAFHEVTERGRRR